jgi:hypothetical protein
MFGNETMSCAPPPLALRTAYTQKGLGIGAGAFVGHALLGPYGAIGGAFIGWLVGNKIAVVEEQKFLDNCAKEKP